MQDNQPICGTKEPLEEFIEVPNCLGNQELEDLKLSMRVQNCISFIERWAPYYVEKIEKDRENGVKLFPFIEEEQTTNDAIQMARNLFRAYIKQGLIDDFGSYTEKYYAGGAQNAS